MTEEFNPPKGIAVRLAYRKDWTLRRGHLALRWLAPRLIFLGLWIFLWQYQPLVIFWIPLIFVFLILKIPGDWKQPEKFVNDLRRHSLKKDSHRSTDHNFF